MKGFTAAVFVGALLGTLVLTGYFAVMGSRDSQSRMPLTMSEASAGTMPLQSAAPPAASNDFYPPAEADIPNNDFGKVVREGEDIFVHTDTAAAPFVGNRMQCASCHLDSGRQANAAPLWAAYGLYPAYRSKNHHVNTFSERLQECFRYSMNGKMPPAGDPVLVALESYSYWLATHAPSGEKLKGQGFLKLAKPAETPSYVRGEAVYGQHCVVCHGPDGAGNTSLGAGASIPALWGPESYNWGAGMVQLSNAAGFVKANMPLGQGYSLSDRDAWDVAMFVDSHERAQDPRFVGSVEETRKQFHASGDSMYGTDLNGQVLGSRAPASGILTKRSE